MAVIGTLKWTCPECAYSNWGSSTVCVLCSTQKPIDIFPKSPSGKFRSHAHSQMTLAWPKVANASGIRSPGPSGATYNPQIICPTSNYPSSSHNSRYSSSKESTGKWICSTCTYNNCPNTSQCTMCRHPRGRKMRVKATGLQIESPHSPSVGESILNYASYVGAVGGAAYSDDRPPSCSRDSPTNPPKAKSGKNGNKFSSNMESRASKKWRCHRCTYENWTKTTKCIMCQAPKKRAPSPPRSEHVHQTAELPHPSSASFSATPDNSSSSHARPQSPPSQPHSHSHSHSRTSSGSLNSNEAAGLHSLKDGSLSSPGSGSTSGTNSTSSSRLIAYSVDPHEIPSAKLKSVSDEVRQIRNRLSSSDWLFLNACLGVVNGEEAPVKTYLRQDGDLARQLSKDECLVLGEPSKFSVGSTLVHLAVR